MASARRSPSASFSRLHLQLACAALCVTVPLTQQACASDGFESSLEVGSEVMAPIYRASGALFPSIYISQAPASAEERRATVLAQVGGAVNASIRLAAGGGPRVPVYPFAWQCYHNGTTLLSYDDLQSELIEPYNAALSLQDLLEYCHQARAAARRRPRWQDCVEMERSRRQLILSALCVLRWR